MRLQCLFPENFGDESLRVTADQAVIDQPCTEDISEKATTERVELSDLLSLWGGNCKLSLDSPVNRVFVRGKKTENAQFFIHVIVCAVLLYMRK